MIASKIHCKQEQNNASQKEGLISCKHVMERVKFGIFCGTRKKPTSYKITRKYEDVFRLEINTKSGIRRGKSVMYSKLYRQFITLIQAKIIN